MKTILFLVLISHNIFSYGQQNPYSNLRFNKVVMYEFEPSGDKGGSIVEANGQLTKNISKRIQIDSAVAGQLNLKLGVKKSFHWGTAACFGPHLGFVYYRGNKIVGYITICLDCNRLYANLELPSQKRGKDEDAVGMSKSFRKFLNQLLKKNKFSHQIPPGSDFDK